MKICKNGVLRDLTEEEEQSFEELKKEQSDIEENMPETLEDKVDSLQRQVKSIKTALANTQAQLL